MKNVLLVLMLIGFQMGFAQKIAYIEVDKILDKMPAFEMANNEIDAQIKLWDDEIDKKFDKIEELYQAYVVNESQMTDEQKKQKQDEIFDAEKQANELKDSKFGNEGELMKLQEQKLKPIYDQIYTPLFVMVETYFQQLMDAEQIDMADPALLARLFASPFMGLMMLRMLGDEHVAANWEGYKNAMSQFLQKAFEK